ncbi:aminotransferase class IV [Cellulomonas sp. RIT-PI-Y]|uniref:aminotransferase class IV n=1 Tax=Cellulomonas sp. RIT-PI-Y TaxID=3035297 RepID=UPI0021DABA4C|nr:aminotransferase class IV [Cellulomonas sp. RIT-PI-Y]
MIVWAHGRLIDPADPVYPVADPVPALGLGLFETCAVRDGVVLALDRHLARLARSSAALGLPLDLPAVQDAVAAVLAASGDAGAGSGSGRLRITCGSPGGPVVVAQPAPDRPAPSVRRSPWVRNERSPLAGHKSTSYAADALALAEAARHGADEALLADTRGRLSEGTTTNVWVEIDGTLLTPTLDCGCLPGIMRERVLEWSAAAGLPVREAELPWSVLDRVVDGEAGLAVSSSLRGLVPAVAVDGRPVVRTPVIGAVQELVRRRLAQ